jgi:hypothetical protein
MTIFHVFHVLPVTSYERKDRVVAQKHSESIQDYILQRNACIQTSM